MEFKGTKGKWVADGTDVLMDDYSSVIQLKHVCESVSENYYNALLISKAPEMLEMLQKVLKINKHHNFNGHLINEQVAQLIKQATEL